MVRAAGRLSGLNGSKSSPGRWTAFDPNDLAGGGSARRSRPAAGAVPPPARTPVASRQEAHVTAERLWAPSAERVERAGITRYLRWLESERGLRFDGYEALWRWSVTELEAFWASIWDFCG